MWTFDRGSVGRCFVKGDELKALTVWVWSSFQLGGVSLTPDELEEEASKIMAHVDENANGKLSFDEFEEYFRRTCKSIEKFRESEPAHVAKPAASGPAAAAEEPVVTTEVPSTAEVPDKEETTDEAGSGRFCHRSRISVARR